MPDPEVGEDLHAISAPLLTYATAEQPDAINIASNQPAPYADFVAKNLEKSRFRFESNARKFDLSRIATKQEYQPQLRPGLRFDLDGDPEATLNLTQILFDGNVREARIRRSDAEAVLQHISILSETNNAVSEDLETYFSYWQQKELNEALTSIADWIDDISKTAKTRAEGGIGNSGEVSLFELKLAEFRTEAAIAASQAQVDLIALGHAAAKKTPVPVHFDRGSTPLEVSQRLAQRAVARYDLELAKRQRRPAVSFQGDANLNLDGGETTTTKDLVVEGPSLSLGQPAKLLVAQEALQLAEHELQDTKSEIEQDLKRLTSQISALKTQHAASKSLHAQARKRLDAFPDLFLAGNANLTEATSLADTLKRAMESEISVKYQILNLQNEMARLTGSFWK